MTAFKLLLVGLVLAGPAFAEDEDEAGPAADTPSAEAPSRPAAGASAIATPIAGFRPLGEKPGGGGSAGSSRGAPERMRGAISYDFGSKQVNVAITLKAGVPKIFAFTAIEPFATATIVLSSNPSSVGKNAGVTVTVYRPNAPPLNEKHNMSETSVRSTHFDIVPGRYLFTLTASHDYGCAVGVRAGKARAQRAPSTR